MKFAPDWVLELTCGYIAVQFVTGHMPLQAYTKRFSKDLLLKYDDASSKKIGKISEDMLFFLATFECDDHMEIIEAFMFNVINFDKNGKGLSIEEKPKNPQSNYAVTGLYFYPNDVVKKAFEVIPSDRGELEITTINQMFLSEDRLTVELMGRGYAWLDTGTPESLLEASTYIEIIERRQGLKVACIEEIAFEKGYINKAQLIELARPIAENQYGQYLLKRSEEVI